MTAPVIGWGLCICGCGGLVLQRKNNSPALYANEACRAKIRKQRKQQSGAIARQQRKRTITALKQLAYAALELKELE